jgi:hypothetical protein
MSEGPGDLKAVLALSAALAVLVLFAGPVPPMDDTYIHLVYGRSLFTSSPLSYDSAGPSSGFTSPLWLLPSAAASLAGVQVAPALLMLASVIAAGAALLAGNPAGLLLVSGPFLFHGGSGMETSLACLMVALVWKGLHDDRFMRWMPAVLAGAVLTRPELAVLGLPLLVHGAKRDPARAAALLLAPAAAAALWVAWNLHATGMPLPGTFYAKQSLPWPEMAGLGGPQLLRGLLIGAPLLLPASAFALVRLARDRDPGWSVPLLLGLAALAAQPVGWFQLRYWVPFLFSCGLIVDLWLRTRSGGPGRLRTVLVLSLLPGIVVFGHRRIAASADVSAIDRDPACLLDCIAGPDETVAAADIGAVGWITGLRILDLDGLTDPATLPGRFSSQDDRWRYIRGRADYLLAFPVQYSALIDAAGDGLEEIGTFRSGTSIICGEESVTLWRILHWMKGGGGPG